MQTRAPTQAERWVEVCGSGSQKREGKNRNACYKEHRDLRDRRLFTGFATPPSLPRSAGIFAGTGPSRPGLRSFQIPLHQFPRMGTCRLEASVTTMAPTDLGEESPPRPTLTRRSEPWSLTLVPSRSRIYLLLRARGGLTPQHRRQVRPQRGTADLRLLLPPDGVVHCCVGYPCRPQ